MELRDFVLGWFGVLRGSGLRVEGLRGGGLCCIILEPQAPDHAALTLQVLA